jgi:hypothetical protein
MRWHSRAFRTCPNSSSMELPFSQASCDDDDRGASRNTRTEGRTATTHHRGRSVVMIAGRGCPAGTEPAGPHALGLTRRSARLDQAFPALPCGYQKPTTAGRHPRRCYGWSGVVWCVAYRRGHREEASLAPRSPAGRGTRLRSIEMRGRVPDPRQCGSFQHGQQPGKLSGAERAGSALRAQARLPVVLCARPPRSRAPEPSIWRVLAALGSSA